MDRRANAVTKRPDSDHFSQDPAGATDVTDVTPKTLSASDPRTDRPALFCGDTLFNAGAGNCHNGGHPNELYETFTTQLANLPDHTRVYPGHDYLANNLAFTLDREPDNEDAKRLLDTAEKQDPNDAMVTTLAREKRINTFFRLHSPTVIARLRETFLDLPDLPDPKAVFLKLRELRNSW